MPLLFCMIIYVLLLIPSPINAQQVVEGVLYVTAKSDEAKPTDSRIVKSNALFNVFQQYGVTSYTQAMPFAKTPSLHDVYTVKFSGNQAGFINALKQNASNLIGSIEQVYEAVELYEPEDHFWQAGSLWHLEKIKADSAWDYTISSDSIDITIIDKIYPDIGHPDLKTKINPNYDVWSGTPLPDSLNIMFHASTVCCFAAAETTETGETPLGYLAASGFNSNIMYMKYSTEGILAQALYASTVLGTEVICISIGTGGGWDPIYDTMAIVENWRAALNEIHDNGTVVVVSAGNLSEGWPPLAQINGYVDERVIQVSGTDSTDHFLVGDSSFSHYSAVDLCAPGYNMYGPSVVMLDSIDTVTGDTIYYPNPWPYYANESGTSFSAPITAGVAALIKSINPCLTPDDVQTILKSTTDPIADANNYPGEIGTGRLNAYKAVKLAYESYRFQNYTVHSGEDITWANPHFIDTLYIEPGGELTINANCFFNVLGIALVDTAAKLTVNNVKLTTTCRNMWNGIEVWGNKNLSQYPYGTNPYHYAQGWLVLDSATIENAHEAVRLWKPGDWSSTGGIVTASNTKFNNCRRSVEFISYHNFHPYSMAPMGNLSKFEECTFNMNEKYYEDTDFEGHVSLFNVEGINFDACKFYNDRDSLFDLNGAKQPKPHYGYGIYAIDAGCSVGALTVNNIVDSSLFKGLEYGIKAEAVSSKNTIYVNKTVFDKNMTGAYSSGLQSPAFVQNNFIVRIADTTDQQTYGGLYLDNYTTGFIVEENVFSDGQGVTPGSWDSKDQSVGVVINNSGSYNNQIYNNKFQNLFVGVLAQNRNRSRDDGRTGLQVRCNEFYNLQYDIAVTADSLHNPNAVDIGIKESQGSNGPLITDPAGNIFSLSSGGINDDAWDIYTECGNKYIKYYYHSQQNGYDLLPDSVSPLLVLAIANNYAPQYTRLNACPPNYSGGGGGSRSALKQQSLAYNISSDSTAALLANLKDGGDTYNTNSDVEAATQDQTMQIRDDLMLKSPYLTDTVMVSTIENTDAMPPAIVTEILLENPHSAKSDTVMDALYGRSDISNGQIAQVEANELVTGAMESLENQRDNFRAKRDMALYSLISSYKTDTSIVAGTDSLIEVLNTCDWPEAKYVLAFEYLEKGLLQVAQDTLQAIANNYVLDAAETDEHINYIAYFNVLKQLKQSGSNIRQIDAAQKQSLYQVAAGGGRAAAWAQNILKFADTLTYKEHYVLPEGSLKKGKVRRRSRDNRPVEKSSLKLYPNPARQYVIIEYALEGDGSGYMIKLADANGFLRQTIKPEDNRGFAVIDTRQLETGSYVAIVSKGGKFVGAGKFVVVN